MATKQFYATGSFKYGTRMLSAGDPVEMPGPHARLYSKLGKVTDAKPKRGPAAGDTITARNNDGTELTGTLAADGSATLKAKPAAKKAAPRKRKAKAKK
jgi:hypothetical protein